MRRVLISFLMIFAGISQAGAGTVEINNDVRCIKVAAARVHQSITGYDGYKDLPGAAYKAVGLNLLRMVKSKPTYALQNAEATRAVVQVVLKPSELRDLARYPQFILSCESRFTGLGSFTQECHQLQEISVGGQLKPAPRYAVDRFDSSLAVAEGGGTCDSGETRLEFNLRMTMNSAQVAEIRDAVSELFVEPARGLIQSFFQERAFFHSYYTNFYDGWVSSLRPGR